MTPVHKELLSGAPQSLWAESMGVELWMLICVTEGSTLGRCTVDRG